MKKYFFLLFAVAASSQAATFPADYLCDNGDKVRLTLNGTEQRLTYTSEKHGTHHGTLDVFKGEGEHKDEVTASVFSLDVNAGRPIAFSMQVRTTSGIVQDVTYNYQLYPKTEVSGKCIPIKNGLMIDGYKNY